MSSSDLVTVSSMLFMKITHWMCWTRLCGVSPGRSNNEDVGITHIYGWCIVRELWGRAEHGGFNVQADQYHGMHDRRQRRKTVLQSSQFSHISACCAHSGYYSICFALVSNPNWKNCTHKRFGGLPAAGSCSKPDELQGRPKFARGGAAKNCLQSHAWMQL